MIDNNLMEVLLPPHLIIKGLIKGKKENYETYLKEFLNNSLYFYKKTSGVEFLKSVSEANSECDCYSGDYGIDFKLMVSESLLYAKANLSAQKFVDSGCIMTSESKKDGSLMSSKLHVLLRNYNFKLDKFISGNIKELNLYRMDLDKFKEKLLTKKNILFFYPYELYFSNDYNFNYGLQKIIEAFESDFLDALKYRTEICEGFETYIGFMYSDFFVILKFENDKLFIVDYVNTEQGETYSRMFFEYVLWLNF